MMFVVQSVEVVKNLFAVCAKRIAVVEQSRRLFGWA